jgi:hypothetical protein
MGISRDTPILPRRVRRDVIVLICVKLAALWLIYQVFFNPHEAPPLRPAALTAHLIGPFRTQ